MVTRESERETDHPRTRERPARERYVELTPRSRAKYEEATKYLPGGNTRGVVYYPPYPAYIETADGCRLRDIDGNTYLDFLNNYTALIHGHTPEAPLDRAADAMQHGTAPGGPTTHEVEWAKHLVDRAPALEQIRFANSGTEAVMNAIRAARAHTGNAVLAKFEGSYNGTVDDVQVSIHPPLHLAGPTNQPRSVPDSAGIPPSVIDNVLTLPFNNTTATIDRLEAHATDLAGVLVAPITGTSVIPGDQAFLDELDAFTTEHDIPLIFDEVVSFRIHHGGSHAAYGIEPDLIAYGKLIGGGFPVGAFGGRASLLDGYDPRGGSEIIHSGTFNANPVTAAAGLAALEAYSPTEVDRLNQLATTLADRARAVIDDHGYHIQLHQEGSLFNLYLTPTRVVDYRTAATSAGSLEEEVFFDLLTQGVRLAPKLMGSLSTPMDETHVDEFITALDTTLARLRPTFEARAPHLIET